MAKPKTILDEIRESIDPKDTASVASALLRVIDELEKVVGRKRPVNNPETIPAPPIDDSVRTVVK